MVSGLVQGQWLSSNRSKGRSEGVLTQLAHIGVRMWPILIIANCSMHHLAHMHVTITGRWLQALIHNCYDYDVLAYSCSAGLPNTAVPVAGQATRHVAQPRGAGQMQILPRPAWCLAMRRIVLSHCHAPLGGLRVPYSRGQHRRGHVHEDAPNPAACRGRPGLARINKLGPCPPRARPRGASRPTHQAKQRAAVAGGGCRGLGWCHTQY